MLPPNEDRMSTTDRCPVRFARLWALAERMDWSGRWPRPFWRWLLRKLDEANGYRFEYLDDANVCGND